MFLVDCCVLSSSFGGRLQPRSVFFHFIFCRLNRRPKQWIIVLPKHSSTADSCNQYQPHRCYYYRLVVVLFWLMAAAWSWCRISFSIFLLPYLPPQTTGKCPPNTFRLGRVSSPTPLPPPQLKFIWLLCILTKRRPPKTCALPFLNFLMCAIGAPQSRDPAAASPSPGTNGGSDSLAAATAGANAIVVESVDAEVYTATAWTPWLRFFRFWPVGTRREEVVNFI